MSYIDYDADGTTETVSPLITAAERAVGASSTSRQTTFYTYLHTFNDAGFAVPLHVRVQPPL